MGEMSIMEKSSPSNKHTAKRPSARVRTEEMTSVLREEIKAGIRPVGSFLPSLLELSNHYHLSKNTVRNGLEALVNEGLIKNIPRIGAKIISATHSKMITLRFGYYASLIQEAKIMELLDKFQRVHPDIQIIPVRLPDNPRDSSAVIQGLLPSLDLLTINLLDYSALSNQEQLLEPVNTRDDIYPFLNTPFIIGHQQYVQPLLFSPIVLCYNKEHFRNKLLPEPNSSWTWKDAINCGRALRDPINNRYGLSLQVPSDNRWPLFLIQNDFSFDSKQPILSLSDPEFRKSMTQYCELIQDESLFPSYFSESDAVEYVFLNQNVSMLVISYMRLNFFLDAPFEYDISPVPFVHHPKTLTITIGVAISKYSTNKLAAKMLVDFLTSYDAQLDIRQQTLSIPAVAAAAEWRGKEKIKNRPSRFSMYREIIPTFKTHQDLNIDTSTLFSIGTELKYYWANINDLDTAIERIKQKLSTAMQR